MIRFKQINQETYLDLASVDLLDEDFASEFADFTNEKADFLSGASVGLILPPGFEENFDAEKVSSALEQMKKTLNEKNISLRLSSDLASSGRDALKKKIQKAKKEKVKVTTDSDVFYYRSNLRAGQQIFHNGDVVVFGDINDSAEIIASGDVIVWGRLRGVAHAGAGGNDSSLIAALKVDSGQLRVSNKLLEINKRDQSAIKKGSLNRRDLGSGSSLKPEIVRIIDGEVRILTSE